MKESLISLSEEPFRCCVCKREDVRLYRSYGTFLDRDDIRCNVHVPERDPEPETRPLGEPYTSTKSGWWVPLVEGPAGEVWGYTSCPDGDIARWTAKPDAAPSPEWREGDWHDETALMLGTTAWRTYYKALRAAEGDPWQNGLVTIEPHVKTAALAVASEQRKLVLAWVRRRLATVGVSPELVTAALGPEASS